MQHIYFNLTNLGTFYCIPFEHMDMVTYVLFINICYTCYTYTYVKLKWHFSPMHMGVRWVVLCNLMHTSYKRSVKSLKIHFLWSFTFQQLSIRELSWHLAGDLQDLACPKSSSLFCTAVWLFVSLKVQILFVGSQVVHCKAEANKN